MPQNNSELDIIRDTSDNINKKNYQNINRKDRLSGNTLGTEEYESFKTHDEESVNYLD